MQDFRANIILMDIEGTTTSISFVKDVLFPYAKANCETFLKTHWHEEQIETLVNGLTQLQEYQEFRGDSVAEVNVANITRFVTYLSDRDLKLAPLKTIQGLIWKNGYETNVLAGHIYDDVPAAFQRWTTNGIMLAIYSSGSVQAQHLLFEHTNHGNLRPYLSRHFDTTVGNKTVQTSYENIALALDAKPQEILFLTDIVKEAEAAKQSGMQVAILIRPGNSPLTDDEKAEYTIVEHFDELNVKLIS